MKRLWLPWYPILCPFHEDHHKKSKWMNKERNPWSKANEEKREVLSGIVLLQWGCREETPLGPAVYSHQNTLCIENSFVNLSRQKIYDNVTFYSQSPHQSDESADSTSRKQNQLRCRCVKIHVDICFYGIYSWNWSLSEPSLPCMLYHYCIIDAVAARAEDGGSILCHFSLPIESFHAAVAWCQVPRLESKMGKKTPAIQLPRTNRISPPKKNDVQHQTGWSFFLL